MANSVEEAVYNFLKADTTISAQFDDVYWAEASDDTYPYIVFWLIDDNGADNVLNKRNQGEARIQFDIWDDATPSGMARGVRLRGVLADKVKDMNFVTSGYTLITTGITEQTIKRESATEPHHFVVDGIIQWRA